MNRSLERQCNLQYGNTNQNDNLSFFWQNTQFAQARIYLYYSSLLQYDFDILLGAHCCIDHMINKTYYSISSRAWQILPLSRPFSLITQSPKAPKIQQSQKGVSLTDSIIAKHSVRLEVGQADPLLAFKFQWHSIDLLKLMCT